MFCPSCGQENVSQETRFCSRCGFLLTGTYNLLQTGGVDPTAARPGRPLRSPRNRGLKQGLFIFLLTFLIVPIIAIMTIAVNAREPFVVAIAAITLFVGGLLRMAYALLFEEHYETVPSTGDDFLSAAQLHMNRNTALPAAQSIPVDVFTAPRTGNWRDTNDLEPGSVVDGTTKLLEDDRRKM
jgi:hypothetical protein